MATTRAPGQRAGLTHDAVLAAARDLVQAGGWQAVTMRALAGRLAVAPNALYSHVRSKTALLDDLLDDLLAEVAVPGPGAEPVEGLHLLMRSTYQVLTAHADLVPLYLARQGARGPHAVRLGEVVDALLAAAGVPTDAVPSARRVLIVHAIGSAAFAVGGDTGRPATEPGSFALSLSWLLAGITGGEHPRIPV